MAVTINGTTGIVTPDITTDSATVDTTTLVVDETNNRVGIGTASPSNPLHVLATAAGETTVKIESNQAGAMFVALDVDTDRDCLLQFQEAGTTRWDIFMNGSSGTNPLLIRDDGGTTQGSFDQSGNFKFNSGYGSATTAYGVRVWVNFQGNSESGGNNPIRGSGNVSTVGDNGQGNHYVNFSTALPDNNYCVVTGATRDYSAPSNNAGSCTGDLETGRFNINTYFEDSATNVDWQGVHAIVVR